MTIYFPDTVLYIQPMLEAIGITGWLAIKFGTAILLHGMKCVNRTIIKSKLLFTLHVYILICDNLSVMA